MAEQKDVEFGWCKTAEHAEHVLRWLFAHKRGWADAKGIEAGTLISRDVEEFYIAIARRTDLTVIPLVTFIRVEGKLIAASLSSVGVKLMECLVRTHDPAFRCYSPGILLLFYQANWAYDNGWANHIAICRQHAIFFAPNSVAGFVIFVGLALHKMGKLCADQARRAISPRDPQSPRRPASQPDQPTKALINKGGRSC